MQFDRDGKQIDLDLVIKAQSLGLKVTGDHINPLKENKIIYSNIGNL